MAPVNIPTRRPHISFTGPVRKTAGIEPMLYIAKTSPVPDPAWDLDRDFNQQLKAFWDRKVPGLTGQSSADN